MLFQREQKYLPAVPQARVMDLCDQHQVIPSGHDFLKRVRWQDDRLTILGSGMVSRVVEQEGMRHHLEVLTTSDALRKRLPAETRQNLRTMRGCLDRLGFGDHLFGRGQVEVKGISEPVWDGDVVFSVSRHDPYFGRMEVLPNQMGQSGLCDHYIGRMGLRWQGTLGEEFHFRLNDLPYEFCRALTGIGG